MIQFTKGQKKEKRKKKKAGNWYESLKNTKKEIQSDRTDEKAPARFVKEGRDKEREGKEKHSSPFLGPLQERNGSHLSHLDI